jgi:hypothetical protein
VDDRRRLQAEIDADNVDRLPDRLRLDDIPFALNAQRDEPAIRAPTDRRREDSTLEAALGARLLQPDPPDHR